MAQLDKPYLKATYNGKNITSDLSKSLISFTYTDSLKDADTLDIELSDTEQKWQSEWYPEKGAKLTATVGIDEGLVLDCGTFDIDEIELKGAPDTVTIRAIAAGFVNGKTRTNKNHIHENKKLSEIIRTVASSAGLTVEGKVSDVKVGRLVQRQETDLRLLRRLATEYGYNFNVRDDKAIFIKMENLENSKSVKTFTKKDLINFSFRDKSTGIYTHAKIKYHNPETGETTEYRQAADRKIHADNELVLTFTAATQAQAIEMSKASLKAANNLQQTGNVTLQGSAVLAAGNVITILGLGRLSGDYIIQSAAHTVGNAEGWIADLEVYKVGYKEPQPKSSGKAAGSDEQDDFGKDGNYDFFSEGGGKFDFFGFVHSKLK